MLLKGISAQTGIAIGNARVNDNFILEENHNYVSLDVKTEQARFDNAFKSGTLTINKIIDKSDNETASLLEAGLMMFDDSFISAVGDMISQGESALDSFLKQVNMCESRLKSTGDEFLIERIEDIKGVAKYILKALLGIEHTNAHSDYGILVAKEITPQELASFDLNKIQGIVTNSGSKTSHTSIIAGNYGIPYVYGIDVDCISDGDVLIVDANQGLVHVNPDKEQVVSVQKEIESIKLQRENLREINLQRIKCQRATLVDVDAQNDIKIYANISDTRDLYLIDKFNPDGIGLFRTEFLYMNRSLPPDEEEQFHAYRTVLDAMNGRRVVFRTADIGFDKNVQFLPSDETEGTELRGIKFSFAHMDLFRTQLRALLRAVTAEKTTNAGIMFPMITSPDEVKLVKRELEIIMTELRNQSLDVIDIGVMVETPEAVQCAEELAREVDFFSIGTNDLTQYTLGIKRDEQTADFAYLDIHPEVEKLIHKTIDAAHNNDIPVSVCGEFASIPKTAKMLIDWGVDELSVAPSKIDEIISCIS